MELNIQAEESTLALPFLVPGMVWGENSKRTRQMIRWCVLLSPEAEGYEFDRPRALLINFVHVIESFYASQAQDCRLGSAEPPPD